MTKTLSEIFATEAAIEYGPFRVEKALGRDWKAATVTVHGHAVKTAPMGAALLALLISEKGGNVRHTDLHLARWPEYGQQASIRNEPESAMKVHINKLKAAIRTIPEGGKEAAAMIVSAYRADGRGEGVAARSAANVNAYRIVLPSADNI